jgi:hypothetical protein
MSAAYPYGIPPRERSTNISTKLARQKTHESIIKNWDMGSRNHVSCRPFHSRTPHN